MNYCLAPFKAVSIRNNNVGSVCCASSTTFETKDWSLVNQNEYYSKLQQDTLNGVPIGCNACINKELKGLPSRKKYFDKILSNNNNKQIEHIEINLTNYCNYSCIMCSSKFSSQWNNISDSYTVPYKLTKKSIDQIITLVENNPVKYIDIQGGEPFYINETVTILERLVSVGYKGKVLIVSNGSNVRNYKLLNLIEKLDVEITISIDTVDNNLYKIIRAPNVSFDTIKNNITILSSSCDVYVNAVMMNLNVYSYHQIKQFANTLGKNINLNWINKPEHLQVNILNDSQKQYAIDCLNQSKDNYSTTLIKAIEQPTESKLLDKFNSFYVEYCTKKKIDPSLWKLWNIK